MDGPLMAHDRESETSDSRTTSIDIASPGWTDLTN